MDNNFGNQTTFGFCHDSLNSLNSVKFILANTLISLQRFSLPQQFMQVDESEVQVTRKFEQPTAPVNIRSLENRQGRLIPCVSIQKWLEEYVDCIKLVKKNVHSIVINHRNTGSLRGLPNSAHTVPVW